MRIVVGWDDAAELATIELVLNVPENEALVFSDPDAFERAAIGTCDTILMPLGFPTPSDAFALFERIHSANPHVPIIGIWRQEEIVELAQFISGGLHSHLMRDNHGNFVFLLTSMIEAAFISLQAMQAKVLTERLRQEVDSIRLLQESVIPQDLPHPPGYRVAARYESSQIHVSGSVPVVMAGGDYYDVFSVSEDSLILLVGDASGHGVKACMSIMTMHSLIRMIHNDQYAHTAEFVAEVNKRLCSSDIVQDEGGFITLFYCALDCKSNLLQWTSAGAPLPLVQDLSTGDVNRLGKIDDGGLPLAIADDWEYQSHAFNVPRNSRLLIYTDGLEEAFPDHGDEHREFGIQGIISSLQSTRHLPVEEALDKLFADSLAFTSGSGRMDDTSVILLERTAGTHV